MTTHTSARIVLKPRKARPFFGRHPWVLDSAVERVEGNLVDGDVADLYSDRGEWIARGLYNSQSRIRLRLYTWRSEDSLDAAFWRRRIEAAIACRAALFDHAGQRALRLVFSEADGLSGLVVDRYGDYVVVQVAALAIALRIKPIIDILAELLRPRGIMVRYDREVARLEGLPATLEEVAWGEPAEGPVFIEEHGIRYGVDLSAGQKTGFFLDQRENRRVAAGYFHGRHVLDLFCYSGGFALCASRLGAAVDVLAIDSSPNAIALAKANAELNEITNARFECGDAFRALETLASDRKKFGGVVLDPPKFARRRQAVEE
ncbi:MAG: class I SAM-dependent rRNA methyltransferase, partial [Pirellulales bacterium]